MLDHYDLRMLNVGYEPNGSDWNWRNVCSPFARIYLVAKGNAEIRFEQFTLKLSEGYMYLIPPYTRHTCIGNDNFVHYYIHLYESPDDESLMFEDISFGMEYKAADADKAVFKMLYTLFPETQLSVTDPEKYDNNSELSKYNINFINRPPCERMLIKGSMLVLISRFINDERNVIRNNDTRLIDVRNYINRHITEDIQISLLSDMACLSQSHFIRKFKAAFGVPPKQYIIRRRIERAEFMLLIHNNPIKSIALSVGFDDVSLFVKTFKSYTGMTPLEYRRHNR